MANSGVAAICNAKQTQPAFNTPAPNVINFTPPTIGDWSSVIQAILQLQWALIPIVNPTPINNMLPEGGGGGGGSGGGGGGGGSGQKPVGGGGKAPKSGNKNPKHNQPQPPKSPGKPSNNKQKWQVTNKVTELVKIVNPVDHSQFVIVERTVTETFQNPATGETLTINHPDVSH